MDIKDLRYFVAVYESSGFARAGVLLNTVQSNVSARVKRLESDFGVTLFERHRRGVRATQKGELLYQYAKRMVALLAETEKALKIDETDRDAAAPAYRGTQQVDMQL